ncbi:MAG: M20/M25/M40 family metallo-hydrolase, partial [Ktedonobacteraceae bacterium]
GLYDNMPAPTEAERIFWETNPLNIEQMLKTEMGVSAFSGEQEYSVLERLGARPTLEIHGISGGFIGEGAKTVIPALAKAKISLRLPPGLKSGPVFALFEKRVKELAPSDVQVTVRNIHGGEAVLVKPDTVPMKAAIAALTEAYGQEPILIREGGSIPIAALFYEILQAPVVLMGFGLPDDNLHAPNEKYSLTQFYKGIRAVANFMQKMGA